MRRFCTPFFSLRFKSAMIADCVLLQPHRYCGASNQWTCPEAFKHLYEPHIASLPANNDAFSMFRFDDDLHIAMQQGFALRSIEDSLKLKATDINIEKRSLERIHFFHHLNRDKADTSTERSGTDASEVIADRRTAVNPTLPDEAAVGEPHTGSTKTTVGYFGCVDKKEIVISLFCRTADFRPNEGILNKLRDQNIVVSSKGNYFRLSVPLDSLSSSVTAEALCTICVEILQQGYVDMWHKLRSTFFANDALYKGLRFRAISHKDLPCDPITVRPNPHNVVNAGGPFEFCKQDRQFKPSLASLKVEGHPERRGFMIPGPSGTGKTLTALCLVEHLSKKLLDVEISYDNCFGIYIRSDNLVDANPMPEPVRIKGSAAPITKENIIATCAKRMLSALQPVLNCIPPNVSQKELEDEWKKYLALFYFVIDEMGSYRDVVRDLVLKESTFGDEVLEQLKLNLGEHDFRFKFLTQRKVTPKTNSYSILQIAFALVGTGVGVANSNGTNSLNDTYVTVRPAAMAPVAVFFRTLFDKKKSEISDASINAMIQNGVTFEYEESTDRNIQSSLPSLQQAGFVDKYATNVTATVNDYHAGDLPKRAADPSKYFLFVDAMQYSFAALHDKACQAFLANARCAVLLAKEIADIGTPFKDHNTNSLARLFIRIAVRVSRLYETYNGWEQISCELKKHKLRCYLVSLAHTQPHGYHLLPHSVQEDLREVVGAIDDVVSFEKGKRSVVHTTPHCQLLAQAQRQAHTSICKFNSGQPNKFFVCEEQQVIDLDCHLLPKHTVANQNPVLKWIHNPDRGLRWELNAGVLMVAMLRTCPIPDSDLYEMAAHEFYERLLGTKTLMIVNAFHYSFLQTQEMRCESLMAEVGVNVIHNKLIPHDKKKKIFSPPRNDWPSYRAQFQIQSKDICTQNLPEFKLPLSLVDPAVPIPPLGENLLSEGPQLTLRGSPFYRTVLEPEVEGHYATSTIADMAGRINHITKLVKETGTVLEYAGDGTPRSDVMLYSDGVMHGIECKHYVEDSMVTMETLLKRAGQNGFENVRIVNPKQCILTDAPSQYNIDHSFALMFPIIGTPFEKIQKSLVPPIRGNEVVFQVSWWNGAQLDGFRSSLSNIGCVRHCILEKELRVVPAEKERPKSPCHQSLTIIAPCALLPADTDVRFQRYAAIEEDGKILTNPHCTDFTFKFAPILGATAYEARVYCAQWSMASFLSFCCEFQQKTPRTIIKPTTVHCLPMSRFSFQFSDDTCLKGTVEHSHNVHIKKKRQ